MAEKYYQIVECPLISECCPKNFKTWKPRGDTPEEAREQVVRHLLNCGHHDAGDSDSGPRDREFCEAIMKNCWVEECEWPKPPNKRKQDGDAKTTAASFGAQPEASVPKPKSHPHWKQPRIPRTPPEVPAAPGEDAIILPSDEVITLPAKEYKSIMDACGRASKAPKDAQRLSSAAAAAFAEEASIFEDVQRFMDQKEQKGENKTTIVAERK